MKESHNQVNALRLVGCLKAECNFQPSTLITIRQRIDQIMRRHKLFLCVFIPNALWSVVTYFIALQIFRGKTRKIIFFLNLPRGDDNMSGTLFRYSSHSFAVRQRNPHMKEADKSYRLLSCSCGSNFRPCIDEIMGQESWITSLSFIFQISEVSCDLFYCSSKISK